MPFWRRKPLNEHEADEMLREWWEKNKGPELQRLDRILAAAQDAAEHAPNQNAAQAACDHVMRREFAEWKADEQREQDWKRYRAKQDAEKRREEEEFWENVGHMLYHHGYFKRK